MNTYSHVAVLIPCLNEEKAIEKVVLDHQKHLPGSRIYVFDNRSTDRTAEIAAECGAIVVPSQRRGKGNVVRHMFDEIDAEIFLMVDGDSTYPAEFAPALIRELETHGMDMVVGNRLAFVEGAAFRRFHGFGNHLISKLLSWLFGVKLVDVLSGYRAFSRKFVKSIPLISNGFEIETELTLQAITKGFGIHEIPISYGVRPAGSKSKLNTFSDGFLILTALFMIFKNYKPLFFFGTCSALLASLGLYLGAGPILDYVDHQYVYRVPMAILASAIGVLSMLSLGVGLILDSVAQYHRENFEVLRKLVLSANSTLASSGDSGRSGPQGRLSEIIPKKSEIS